MAAWDGMFMHLPISELLFDSEDKNKAGFKWNVDTNNVVFWIYLELDSDEKKVQDTTLKAAK